MSALPFPLSPITSIQYRVPPEPRRPCLPSCTPPSSIQSGRFASGSIATSCKSVPASRMGGSTVEISRAEPTNAYQLGANAASAHSIDQQLQHLCLFQSPAGTLCLFECHHRKSARHFINKPPIARPPTISPADATRQKPQRLSVVLPRRAAARHAAFNQVCPPSAPTARPTQACSTTSGNPAPPPQETNSAPPQQATSASHLSKPPQQATSAPPQTALRLHRFPSTAFHIWPPLPGMPLTSATTLQPI